LGKISFQFSIEIFPVRRPWAFAGMKLEDFRY
jgi:hypothetical protein